MRFLAKRVEHQQIHSFEELPGVVWNPAAIRQVREGPDPEAENCAVAVEDRHRNDLLATDAEWSADLEQVELRQSSPACRRRVEDVRKRPPYVEKGRGVAETRHRAALDGIESPHIVQPEDVIRVAVGEEDGVDPTDVEGERLRPQVGPGIDQQR
jgi:hypothetical protein